ncbi:HlyD family type I secretion periplasmic adaptor subunit [Sansalvadorimonas sp. 2012CJ34-2]|uniref:Membrane fusion protein (MFP) family protein n=1 Tax=Parendozoicomonas callyspongiae TaxID=2942213 RepID=A0ABT0PIV8_9GAMM|nr:HlyD family type I secretion periplasmic adaptor subunit [Sansalvadorimonas sp. 2012CJ34-2]MCL6271300.1 HlyD family type I secretion periplasmic adaptor subunit [Sansalvadorimonas sp. 2012CJ34-2]
MWEGWKKLKELWVNAREFYDKQPEVDRRGNELEFLPAAVEILETPASPVGRTVALLIVALFAIAVAWAWFGKIDIESVAQGRIIPMGQVKAIQPLEIGKVEEIFVHEGEWVEAGQPLVKLDPTESEVDVQQVAYELRDSQMNTLRLELLLETLDDKSVNSVDYNQQLKQTYPDISDEVSSGQLQLQQRLLTRDLQLYRSTMASVNASIEQQQATIKATLAEIERLNTLKPLFDEREQAYKSLMDKGHASSVEWLNAKEQQVSTSQGLIVERNRLQEVKASLVALKSEATRQDKEFRSQRLTQLQSFQTQAHSSKLTLTKAKEREQNRYLLAPVAGTIQQLQVHTVGGVVQPAQPLMVIVPDKAVLEVEAQVLNKDIGFLRSGQKAEIKVESFPYTRYGLISGEVRHLSKDAVEQEGIGRVYPMRVTLNETRILVDDRWEKLQPGMTVTVEVKTGKRRLLEYFLAPFLTYVDESMKER